MTNSPPEIASEGSSPGRAARVAVSAALLLAAAVAFVGSLALPAVTLWHMKRRMHVEGWTCATTYGPTAGTNGFLVLAFAFWGAAHWFRSIWAWWLAAIAAVGAFLVHAMIGAWPAYEGIEHLHSGYWTWLAATATVMASFLVLPKPVRPPPDETISVAERDRGRAGIATILGSAAIVTVLASHLFVPVPVGGQIVEVAAARGTASAPGDGGGRALPGVAPTGGENGGEDDRAERSYYYQNGPMRSSGAVPPPRKVTLPVGTVVEYERRYEYDWIPLASAQFMSVPGGVVEFAYLALPLLFVAAAATRRASWRWTGAALSAAVAVATFTWVVSPWPCSGIEPHPLDVVWQAPPCALALAFVLLPPRRGG